MIAKKGQLLKPLATSLRATDDKGCRVLAIDCKLLKAPLTINSRSIKPNAGVVRGA
jgi:hypothetical protein